MDRALLSLVWDRARACCEYCRRPERLSSLPFEIDHIIAEKHGGPTIESNLALSCFACNRYKGPNIAGVDATSGRVVRLFHPRTDRWTRHFRWDGSRIEGRTPVARATISVLEMNHPEVLTLRLSWSEEGVFVLGRGFTAATRRR